MGSYARNRDGSDGHAYLVRRRFDSKAREVGQALVERTVVPEIGLGAADAAMARLDREADAAVPADRSARIVGCGAAAAHFVQAESLARIVIVERFDEQASVIIGPAVAGIVHAPRIELLRAALLVELRDSVEGEEVDEHAGHDFRDGRAALNINDRLSADHLVDRRRRGGVRLGGLHAPGASAVSPGDHRLRTIRNLAHDVGGGSSANAAVGPVGRRRHRALAAEQVLAAVFLYRVLEAVLGLVARRREKRLGVVERDLVEEDVGHDWVRGA